jgi:hypothetical protein
MAKSDRGEKVPELADLLRNIADRVQHGHGTRSDAINDAETLRALARSVDGIGQFELRLHSKRGGQRRGIIGFERDLARAQAIHAYIEQMGGSEENAALETCEDPDSRDHESRRKAYDEFKFILRLPEKQREFLLYMKRQEALGRAKVKRIKRDPDSGI